MTPPERPLSLSLDLDNKWSYLKTHGDAEWRGFPSYLDELVSVLLPALERHKLTITVFIVGQDAAIDANRRALRAIADAGHEIGNHSFHHEPWLHRYTPSQVDDEIASAEAAIEAATGRRPRGFRGPGFSCSPATLDVLARRDYIYDASTFPTFLGPAARAYYFWHSRKFSRQEWEERSQLFGTLADGMKPLTPYMIDAGGPSTALGAGRALVEIPVTTCPIVRAPMHMSYLLYLSRFSRQAADVYLRSALALCRLTGVEPSFLLHPLDFLGGDRVKGLSFFPGMDLHTDVKLQAFDRIIANLTRHFDPITMEQHAAIVLGRHAAWQPA